MLPSPVEILQHLIRFDTSNPPGSESALIAWVTDLLRQHGIEPEIITHTPGRPNLVARIKGRGEARPLLLYGHVDTVPVTGQQWKHDPFEADIIDGFVWGRGALDMKGGIAMMLSAFLRCKTGTTPPPGDVILALTVDEEAGSLAGAKFLIRTNPELFAGVKHGLSEFGGFPLTLAGHRAYPISVAERHSCTLRATLRGMGGHGAQRTTGGAMAELGRVLVTLDRLRLPAHVTPVAEAMLNALRQVADEALTKTIDALLNPATVDNTLDTLGTGWGMFEPLLHNSATPTIVRGGSRVNVVPTEVQLTLDGRVLPGISREAFVAEVQHLLGKEVLLTVTADEPEPILTAPDMSVFPMLAEILRDMDPTGTPVPYQLSGASDARVFSQLGIQTYGFLPMKLPAGFAFAPLVHAPDERIPADAVDFGAEAIYQAVVRYR